MTGRDDEPTANPHRTIVDGDEDGPDERLLPPAPKEQLWRTVARQARGAAGHADEPLSGDRAEPGEGR